MVLFLSRFSKRPRFFLFYTMHRDILPPKGRGLLHPLRDVGSVQA